MNQQEKVMNLLDSKCPFCDHFIQLQKRKNQQGKTVYVRTACYCGGEKEVPLSQVKKAFREKGLTFEAS